MDTRYWGPSGWRLLHLITFSKDKLPSAPLQLFFDELPFVIPCKFCRTSLSQYYEELVMPVTLQEESGQRFLYDVHNKVNGKLKKQGLNEKRNPSFESIKMVYNKYLESSCSAKSFLGWDFLISIANITPGPKSKFKPLPNAPAPPYNSLSIQERLRFNLLSSAERITHLRRWWDTIGDVLPIAAWRIAWLKALKENGVPPVMKGRRAMLVWLYRMEKVVLASLSEDNPHNSLDQFCKEAAVFSSDCGRLTCRAKKQLRRILTAKKNGVYSVNN